MSEPKKPPASSSSRTVVIVAVAVLIVVAIAGIVLAGRQAPAEPTAAAPPAAPAVSASTPQAAASPTDALLKELVFDPASDKLPPRSSDDLARFADAARASASSVRLSARFMTGANKARDLELVKARTGAIRHALQADGIHAGKIEIELAEMPEGSLTDAAGNRVNLTLY